MKVCCNVFVGMLLLSSIDANATAFVQQPPRAFGYVIGDVVEQRIHLRSDGRNMELEEIPPERRVDRWLERLSSTLITDSLGLHWLTLRYQVINSPSELVTISLPALNLATIKGEALDVEAWPMTISPLIPEAVAGSSELQPMQPDRQPVPPDSRVAVDRLKYTGIALVLTIFSWLGWWLWRQHTDARRLPFSRAFQEMRKLGKKGIDENRDAWLALHRAFNGVAGRTINSGTIEELIRQETWLEPLQLRIEAFYAASVARFFAQVSRPKPFELFEFGKLMHLAEKQHSGGHRPRSQR